MIRRLIILSLIVGCATEHEDCAGVAGGLAVEDDCGVCDSDTSNDCVEDCLGVWGGDATLVECEALGDMSALQDIINLNNLFPSDAPFYEPTEIGEQTWLNGRLTSLDLSNWSLDTLPNSISSLTALTNLNLKSNNLIAIPNIICDIYDSLDSLDITNNYICPQYPECITDEDLDYQNQDDCENMGCIDNTACNYDETVLYSYLNDTCWYPNVGCDCEGTPNGNVVQDCAGVCGGTALEDECGVCGGSGIDATTACCSNTGAGLNGEVADCAGVCGGDAVVDECGTCEGSISDATQCDCPGGTVRDCAGICGGNAVEDCAGICDGSAVVDACGTCGGNNFDTEICTGCMDGGYQQWSPNPGYPACNYAQFAIIEGECQYNDCNGDCGGNAVEDECGVCGGDGSSCSPTVCDIDGNCYETIQIGEQLWMAENLKVTKYRDGSAIPTGHSDSDWGNLSTGAYAVYDNNSTNADIYGNLYNWHTVDDSRGVCPDGFHVPSDEEFMELEMDLGMSEEDANITGWRGTDEGSKLAGSSDLWNDGDLDNNSEFGTSGFNVLPAGSRGFNSGIYYNMGFNGYFWSSSEGSSNNAWYRLLNYGNSLVYRYLANKHYGFSIRCLGD